MSKQALKGETIRQDIALLMHLRPHLQALSDPTTLQLLSLAATTPITNVELSRSMGKTRHAVWYQLQKLKQLGLLEKVGHDYRVSPYAMNLIEAAGLALRAVVNGKLPRVENPAPPSADLPAVLKWARLGVESLYDHGGSQAERDEQLRTIQKLEAAIPRL